MTDDDTATTRILDYLRGQTNPVQINKIAHDLELTYNIVRNHIDTMSYTYKIIEEDDNRIWIIK